MSDARAQARTTHVSTICRCNIRQPFGIESFGKLLSLSILDWSATPRARLERIQVDVDVDGLATQRAFAAIRPGIHAR